MGMEQVTRAMRGLFLIVLAGTGGYYILGHLHVEGVLEPTLERQQAWGVLDCLYMTVITLSTVGYGEVVSHEGSLSSFPDVRLFTVVLIVLGIGFLMHTITSLTAFVVEGKLSNVLERRKVLKAIQSLRNHYIVCGIGSVGLHIAEELARTRRKVLVLEQDEEHLKRARAVGCALVLQGDATLDETLLTAGVEHAAGLVACLANDRDNLFLVLSARQLNPEMRIISKAVDLPTRQKLLRAGADGVVSPSFVGGLRMVSELIRPAVVSFLDEMLRATESPVRFAEVEIGQRFAERTLGDVDIPARVGLPVLAVKPPGQGRQFLYNPGPEVVLQRGARLVVMGEVARVTKLEEMVGDEDGATFIAAPQVLGSEGEDEGDQE